MANTIRTLQDVEDRRSRMRTAGEKLKAPSIATLRRWSTDGVAKATDGCRVEPDGTCEHGAESWLLVLGLI